VLLAAAALLQLMEPGTLRPGMLRLRHEELKAWMKERRKVAAFWVAWRERAQGAAWLHGASRASKRRKAACWGSWRERAVAAWLPLQAEELLLLLLCQTGALARLGSSNTIDGRSGMSRRSTLPCSRDYAIEKEKEEEEVLDP
jgi:hypothetical protein